MCMRASELRKFWHFTFLNCYFFQYFVGTSDTLLVQNDMLVGLHVPTNLQIPTNTNIEQMNLYASERSERA